MIDLKKGYCHICQKYTDLSFEHIPPHKAFNFMSAKVLEGDQVLKLITDNKRLPWQTDGLKYTSRQKGVGKYSLCKSCNNLTGKYYGTEYIKFAITIHKFFPEIKSKMELNNSSIAYFNINGINPLLFAKQILSMFCSTCEHITKNDPNIISLLLNKNKKGLDSKKYRLSMFLIDKYRIGYTGFQIMFLEGIGSIQLASIDAYPFGFVLEFDPRSDIKNRELDITSFFNDYDCKEYNLNFGIPVLERNSLFSCDYRSKNEISKCKEE